MKMAVYALQVKINFIIGPSICLPLLRMLCSVSKNARYRGNFS
jgi:hypothetical protein